MHLLYLHTVEVITFDQKEVYKSTYGKRLAEKHCCGFHKMSTIWHIPYKRCDVNFVQRRSDGLFHMKCAIPMRYASNVFFYDRTLKENDIWLPHEDEVEFQINREEFNNQSWRDSPLCRWCESGLPSSVECLLQLCCKDDE